MRLEEKAFYLLTGRNCSNCGNRMSIGDNMITDDYDSSPGIYCKELPDRGINVYPDFEIGGT